VSMNNVFVSYKAEDRTRLKPLVAALEAEGFDVWWDAHIGGGTDWREEIQQHLDAARCVIVAWSERSAGPEGQFVCDEAGRAKKAGSYVPIKIDEVDPPLGFGGIQALSFVGWKGKRSDPRFVALVAAVNAHLSGEARVVRRAKTAERKVSRRTVMAGGAGALAIAGIGGWALLKPGVAAASNRIAVMSFSNMSGDPAQAYFSDGIAEELRGALSRIGMQVIGRASSDAVKDLDTHAAAAKLSVANILTGSVRRSPETIRIGAQLVNGQDGVEKWAQNYDRAPGDTIKIQSDIAEQVASALSIALGAAKKAALTLGGTANAKAQDLYLQARALGRSADGPEAMQKVIALNEAALAADPGYGDAECGKASSLAVYATQFATSPAEAAAILLRAEQSAKRAASLMPGSGRPAAVLALISSSRLDFLGGLRGYEKALATDPDDAFILRGSLNDLPWIGDGAQALTIARKAITLDPLNATAYTQLGNCLYVLRRYADATDAQNKALAIAPQRNLPRYYISQSLLLLDRAGEARAVLAKMPPDDVFRQTNEAIIAARGGDRAGADAAIGKIRGVYADQASYQYGQIYTQLGDADRAFAAFDKAIEARDPGLINLKRDPFLDPIRRDPRFAALLKRLKFP
ncbi:MAG: TIR domain-containing protein, partial [Sphingomicrobium sp.]